MPDNDLGRAHGEIQIKSDVDVAKAIAALQALKGRVDALGDRMSKAAKQAVVYQKAISSLGSKVKPVTKAIADLGKSIKDVALESGKSISKFLGLESALKDLKSAALEAYGTINDLHEAITSLGGMSASAFQKIGGFAKELEELPRLLKVSRDLNRNLRLTEVAVRQFGKVTGLSAAFTFLRRGILGASLAIGAFGRRLLDSNNIIVRMGRTLHNNSSHLQRFTAKFKEAGSGASSFARTVSKVTPEVRNLISGLSKVGLGLAAMQKGFRGMMNLSKVFIGAFAGLSVVSSGLTAVSTTVFGLANAIKQLSGGVLLLPGIYATAATAIGVATVAFKGLGLAMKAAWANDAKFAEELKKVPKPLQDIAKQVHILKPRFQKLNETIQSNFWAGLGKNIQDLAKNYFPILERGTVAVSRAFASARQNLVSFLLEGQTKKDFSGLFGNTAIVIGNLSNALKPFLEGLRDIGMVGSQYLSQLTGGAQMLAARFKVWAAAARESGQAMEWIERSIQGIRDLKNIVVQAGKGLGELFKALRGNGANALSKTSDAMDKFAENMRKASEGEGGLAGFVGRISQLQKTSSKVFDALVSAVKKFSEASRGMGEEFYRAFGSRLTGTIGALGQFLAILTRIINAIPGMTSLLGTIAAMAVAGKGIQVATRPLRDMISLLGGMGITSRGLQQSLGSLAMGIQRVQESGRGLGREGSRTQAGLGRMRNAALNLASALTGPVVIGIQAAIVALMAMYQTEKANSEAAKRIEEGYRDASESVRKYGEEIRKANGEVSTEAIDRLNEATQKFNETLKENANNKQNFWDYFSEKGTNYTVKPLGFFKEMNKQRKLLMGQSVEFKAGDYEFDKRSAESAEQLQNALQKLGVTQEDLTGYLSASDETWNNFVARLKESGVESGFAMSKLNGLRKETQDQANAAKAVGETNLTISNGIRTLASETSSATDKLNAMKAVLTALGIIQSSAAESAANWTLRTKQMAESITQEFSGIDFSAVKNAGELTTKTLEDMAKKGDIGASTLTSRLATMRDEFYATAQSTGDAQQAYRQMDGTFKALADATGIPIERLRELAKTFGIVPKEVHSLVSIEGLDTAQTDIWAIVQQLRTVPEGKTVTVDVHTDQGMRALEEAGVKIGKWDPDLKKLEIEIPPGMGEETIRKVQQILIDSGVPEAKIKAALDKASNDQVRKDMSKPVTVEVQAKQKETLEKFKKATGGSDWTEEDERQAEEWYKKNPGQRPVNRPPVADETKPKTEPEPEKKKEELEVEVKGTDAAIGAVNAVRTALEAAKSESANTSLNLEVKGTDAAIGAVNAVRDAINAMKANVSNVSLNVELKGTDAAIGAANAVVDAVNNMANQIVSAVQKAGSAVDKFIVSVRNISTTFTTVASQALSSGSSLGDNFAKGIASKESAVRAAAMRLAKAASDPLPRSPAKIGPFSGRGWTPFRGRSLAVGFAQGISKGAPLAQNETLDMVIGISKALDQLNQLPGINAPQMLLGANRKPGASGAMFYRDPEVTDEDLRKQREEKQKQEKEDNDLRVYKEMLKLPELIEKRDKAAETLRTRTETLNKAKGTGDAKKIKSAQESYDTAQKSLDQYNQRIQNARSGKTTFEDGTVQASSGLTNFVKSLDSAEYSMGAFNESMMDCSGFVSAVANEATGREAFSERTDTTRMREFLLSRGFKEGMGGEGDLRVGWWDNGGGQNGHTALTLPDGTRAESTTGGVRYGPGAAGHDSSQFTNHMYLPGSAVKDISGIYGNTSSTDDNTKKELDEARKNNKVLDKALKTFNDPKATDEQIIRALQDVSDYNKTAKSPLIRKELESQMDTVMSERGIKKYDPYEGALKDDKSKVQTAIKAVQNIISLHDTVLQGIEQAKQTFELLARGLENTDSVNQLIDGVQAMADTVMNVVTTIVDMIEIVAKVAATAGAAIPGIGPVIAAIANIVDIGGIVQTVVDTVQQVVKIGMRYLGKVMSILAGGKDGALEGKVRTLLDTNDQTIKRWSEDNPSDKRSSSYDPFNVIPDKEVGGSGINNLNVYANPNAPADEIINEAMYAVKSSGTGAYSD